MVVKTYHPLTQDEVDVVNAGFDAAVNTILTAEKGLSVWYQGYVNSGLASAEGHKTILDLVNNILAATDAKRAQQANKKAAPHEPEKPHQ